jgi:hypothetical protein
MMAAFSLAAQDGLNQVIIVNGGQFGNPNEQANIASFDPTTGNYRVFDTIPVNSIQDVLVEGDFAYVAAQDLVVKYDLDTYEVVAETPFPGQSAHQLEISGDKLFATNYFAQADNNLYIFDKHSLSVTDTVAEISHPGGTMAVLNDKLYISQNRQGSIDMCPPFGCFNDTMGYVAEVDINSGEWIRDIELDNDGREAGRIFSTGSSLILLNEVSNTSTALLPATGENFTRTVDIPISTLRYRTEGFVLGGQVISLFAGGIGILSDSLNTADIVVDTPVTAFTYDQVNDRFFITSTDFFSFSNGYAFKGSGMFEYDFPVGYAPEAIGVHYNHQPQGNDFETESRDTIIVDVNSIAIDPDGDEVVASRVENAPVNGVVTILQDGSIRYVSLSPGSADAFRIEVCDTKLNPLCSFIGVTILPVSSTTVNPFGAMEVFPNPTSGPVWLSRSVPGLTGEVLDATGVVIHRFSESYADLSAFPKGIYFLRLTGPARGFLVLPVLKF